MRKLKRGLCAALALAVAFTGLPLTPAKNVQAATEQQYVVVLDPGHGGGEAGARGYHSGVTYREEELNWKITQYTKQALSAYSNIKVYLTRDYDDYLSVSGRVDKAYIYDADLLVSQHCNASTSSSPNGASVMISRGTYRVNLHNKEKQFGTYVMNELGKLGIYRRFPETGGMEYRMSENGSTYPNGAARDYYGIVARSVERNLPGVIIEHAFVTNPSDAKNYLRTNAQLQKLGQADARAIIKYFNAQGGGSAVTPTPTPKPQVQAKWVQKSSKWYYKKSDGSYAKGWLSVSGKKYYLDASGIMQVGWKKIGNYWYYFNTSGVMQKGWLVKDGMRYLMLSNGRMFKGLRTVNGRIFYFTPKAVGKYKEGARITGWKQINNKWYYFTPSGAYKGWHKIKGSWYYFNTNGVMQTGWLKDNGKRYYLYKSPSSRVGKMASNTKVKIGGKTYNFNSSGACTNY